MDDLFFQIHFLNTTLQRIGEDDLPEDSELPRWVRILVLTFLAIGISVCITLFILIVISGG